MSAPNKIKLVVELFFSEKVSKKGENDVINNVLDALVHECDTKGIAPESEEAFTTTISVVFAKTGRGVSKDLMKGEYFSSL